jgi:hypothetical protein
MALAVGALLASPPAGAAGKGRARAASSARTFSHAAYVLVLPAGWAPAAFDPATRQHRKTGEPEESLSHAEQVTFADDHGNYFMVLVDQGTDFEADAIWRLRARGGRRVEIASEGARCVRVAAGADGEGEEECPAGDGWLALGSPAIELQGHQFSFLFGNTSREDGVSVEVFRGILRSFRAKATTPR